MKASDIVVVSEPIARAGSLLMWTLSGETDLGTLTKAWEARGLSTALLPTKTTPAVALRRAAYEVRAKHKLVRPLGKGEGYAVVGERAVGDDLEYSVGIRAKLVGGSLTIEGPPTQEHEKLTIQNSYGKHLRQLTAEDISSWLVGLIPRLDGVSMRNSGGVYFIPHDKIEDLNKIVEVLREVTNHTIYRIPAMRGDDAVAAILDAVSNEAVAEASEMEAELEAAQFGARGYQHRIVRTANIEAKISRYENLLGTRLEGLRERLDTLRANLAIAALKADAEKDAANGVPLL